MSIITEYLRHTKYHHHYLHPNDYKISLKHFLRFLMVKSQCWWHIPEIALICTQIKNFVHHLHSNVSKISSKYFLGFIMSWSQCRQHISPILEWFAQNLIIFGPFFYALVTVPATHCNHFKAIWVKFDHFWTVGFSDENKNFVHHLHSNVYNIRSKTFWINQEVWLWLWRHIVSFYEILETKNRPKFDL